MSVKVMARVWAHSQRKDGELLVMLALADFANDAGESWPSIPVLAAKARLTERQARRVLNTLEAVGEIRRRRSNGGRNRRNHYFIAITENPDNITLKELQGKNNPVICDTKTLTPMSGALNHHRTINKREARKERAASSNSDSRITNLLAFWAAQFRDRFGAGYVRSAKDAALLKRLLGAGHSEGNILALMRRFLDSKDDWISTKGGYTIGVFYSQFNKLNSTKPKATNAKVREMPA
jgi:hypothetical protein